MLGTLQEWQYGFLEQASTQPDLSSGCHSCLFMWELLIVPAEGVPLLKTRDFAKLNDHYREWRGR